MAFTKVVLTGVSESIKNGFTRLNSLIDDLLSTTAGKGASQVGITDAGDYMSSANVEDALQEIYADTAATRLLVDAFGENSSTTTGLTWGWNAGTIRYDNTITTVAAGTLSLTDDATNYVECDTAGSVSRNTTGFTAGRYPMRTVVCASGVQTTSTDSRSYFSILTIPLPVTKGGTGLATITDHGIMLGSGTGAVTPLGVATNGQIPIGSTGADPVLAEIAGTANQITSTAGAGTITLSVPSDFRPPGTVTPVGIVTITNEGLHLLDTNASHDLIIKPGSDLTADKTLTITTGDSDRTLTLNADTTVSTFGASLTDDADAATARATLAAPAAVDLRGYLAGLTLSNAADTDHDITIAVGTCRDSTNAATLTLASALTKQIDAVWAAGTNAGGLFSGVSLSANTWYHLFLIRKDSDGSIDAGFDTSVTAANKPAGYTYYRRLGSVVTDSVVGDPDLFPFIQNGDLFYRVTPPGLDIGVTDLGASEVEYTLYSVPSGVRVEAICDAAVSNAGADAAVYIHPTDVTDEAPSLTANPFATCSIAAAGTLSGISSFRVLTDTSAKIAARAAAASTTLKMQGRGYVDRRGRDD